MLRMRTSRSSGPTSSFGIQPSFQGPSRRRQTVWSVSPRGRFGQDARSAWEPGFLVEGAATLRRVAEPVNLSFRSASLFSRVGVLVVRGPVGEREAPQELGGPAIAPAFQRLRPCGRRESAHSSQRDPHVNVKSHVPSTVVRRASSPFVSRAGFSGPGRRGRAPRERTPPSMRPDDARSTPLVGARRRERGARGVAPQNHRRRAT